MTAAVAPSEQIVGRTEQIGSVTAVLTRLMCYGCILKHPHEMHEAG